MGVDEAGPLRVRLRAVLAAAGADPDAQAHALHAAGLTDGVAVVVPTAARLDVFLGEATAAAYRGGPIPLASIVPDRGDLAALAVMAGCPPHAFGVVLAGMAAMTDPAWNLLGVMTTTSSVAPLVVARGPVADRLGGADGPGADQPRPSASTAVGRTLALAMRVLGGTLLGIADASTVGPPPGSGWCLVERGAGTSTVAVAAMVGWAEVVYGANTIEEEVATFVAAVAAASVPRRGVVAVLPPEVARRLAAAGWDEGALAADAPALARVVVTGGVGVKGLVVPMWGASDIVEVALEDGHPSSA